MNNRLFAIACCLLFGVGWGVGCDSGRRRGGTGNNNDAGGGGKNPPGSQDMAKCVNLACDVQMCTGAQTSLSGTVFDPAGTTPLYNVSVYVPNAALDDIPDGINITGACTSCQAPLTGQPIVVTQTDSHGHFQLNNVPSGSNIPLVFQTGKFRREVMVPTVMPCQDNPVSQKDTMGAEMITRLPRNQSEGHIPLIAITTGGCEGLECVVRLFGFDDAEFTNSAGSGRIHLYTGNLGGHAVGSTGDSTEAYTFWGGTTMPNYDMILNSCECQPYPRDSKGPAYANMQRYLDHGGRLFTSDFQYNWFTDPQAPAEFKSVAKWTPNQMAPVYTPPFFVDTTFPKGMALDEWLQFVFMGKMPPPDGEITLTTILYNVTGINPGTTRWIYDSSNKMTATDDALGYTSKYISFNTPFSPDADAGASTQCGRAVFADIHVSNNIHSSVYPTGCQALTKTQQVTAFEFLFFDIGSCVQDDAAPPKSPPIQ